MPVSEPQVLPVKGLLHFVLQRLLHRVRFMTSNPKYDNEKLNTGADMEERKKGEALARSAPHESDTRHRITQRYLAQSNTYGVDHG